MNKSTWAIGAGVAVLVGTGFAYMRKKLRGSSSSSTAPSSPPATSPDLSQVWKNVDWDTLNRIADLREQNPGMSLKDAAAQLGIKTS